MDIPKGKSGYPTVSPTMLRRYGASGFDLQEEEVARGCPRQFKAFYVDRVVQDRSDVLDYGTIMHRAFQLMESESLNPEEALEKAWANGSYEIAMDPEWLAEAADDMARYMARETTPLGRYATLGTELRLSHELYVDEEFGPVWIQGIVDRISIDFDDPALIHIGDWKTVRQPPSIDDVRKSVQAKTYVWLAYQCLEELLPADVLAQIDQPRVFFHLDAIKWRELDAVYFSDDDLEKWREWAISLVRRILRDTEAKPRLNEGCPHCPVRDSCPEWLGLPLKAKDHADSKPDMPKDWTQVSEEDRDLLAAWLGMANTYRLLLEKAVKDIDNRFKADAKLGPVVTSTFTWSPTTKYDNEVDLRKLHSIIGDEFYDQFKGSQALVERIAKGRSPAVAADVLECCSRVPTGITIERKATPKPKDI
jgi:hypothetical protein